VRGSDGLSFFSALQRRQAKNETRAAGKGLLKSKGRKSASLSHRNFSALTEPFPSHRCRTDLIHVFSFSCVHAFCFSLISFSFFFLFLVNCPQVDLCLFALFAARFIFSLGSFFTFPRFLPSFRFVFVSVTFFVAFFSSL